MRLHHGRQTAWHAIEVQDDLAAEIEAGEFVDPGLREREAVSGKNDWGFDIARGQSWCDTQVAPEGEGCPRLPFAQ